MAEVSSQRIDDDERQLDPLSKLKHDLEGWREVLLPLNHLISWDRSFYPAILVGFTTFIFIAIWYFDPSVLTAFSVLGLAVTLIDFLVPIIGPNLLGSQKWDGAKERQYEQICKRILNAKYHLEEFKDMWCALKTDKPKVFFLLLSGLLVLFAWIGSQVNNLVLTYILVNIFLLMPGLRRQQVVQKYLSSLGATVRKLIGRKSKPN
ncbi:hypothetical protein ACJMK2_034215 [Sinanodonta woodiana]|uniref:RETREG1-3/ARL6IP-like N-terminal reticulon-homology domain-containing protein n=1 Tax=Sinanodonta woodiana TaxID=1069815 RepID=A0ABD3WS76_SINWO